MLKRIYLSILSALTFSSITTPAFAEGKFLSVEDAHSLAQKGELTLIDIRTPDEWKNSEIPEFAELLQLQRDDFVETIIKKSKSNPDSPIALICRSGARSTHAIKMLMEAGIKDIYNVKEGSLGWKAKGLPTTPYNLE